MHVLFFFLHAAMQGDFYRPANNTFRLLLCVVDPAFPTLRSSMMVASERLGKTKPQTVGSKYLERMKK